MFEDLKYLRKTKAEMGEILFLQCTSWFLQKTDTKVDICNDFLGQGMSEGNGRHTILQHTICCRYVVIICNYVTLRDLMFSDNREKICEEPVLLLAKCFYEKYNFMHFVFFYFKILTSLCKELSGNSGFCCINDTEYN